MLQMFNEGQCRQVLEAAINGRFVSFKRLLWHSNEAKSWRAKCEKMFATSSRDATLKSDDTCSIVSVHFNAPFPRQSEETQSDSA